MLNSSSVSILFIQIAIKINLLRLFAPFLLLMNQHHSFWMLFLVFCTFSTASLQGSGNHLHLMFIFLEIRARRNNFAVVDLCSLERYDFYFHGVLRWKAAMAGKTWEISYFFKVFVLFAKGGIRKSINYECYVKYRDIFFILMFELKKAIEKEH